MKTMKRLVSIAISAMCCIAFMVPAASLALETTAERTIVDNSGMIGEFYVDTEHHATGSIEVSDQEREEFLASFPQDENENTREINSLPSSVDLSTSAYFPPIGNQGAYGSCVSWATTYYQFTYEAHKLNGITTTANNAYSPRWTFNFTNHGCNSGTNYTSAYDVLRNQGAVTMGEYSYNVSSSNFYKWLNNESAMLNALSTKLTNMSTTTLNTTSNQITSSTDTDLNALKQVLNNGKVLQVDVRSINGLGNWMYKKTTSNEWAACRAYMVDNNDGGHSLTIVGYNDNIQCDVNGNGTIEATEKGAFKLANSWGTGWQKGNNGYIWVMYDALNKVSANTTNNWENGLPGTRIAIFDRSGGSANHAFSITVSNQIVNLAAVVNLNTDDCHNIAFYTNRCTGAYTSGTQNVARQIAPNYAGDDEILRDYTGPFVLDLGSLDDNIINYLSGYRWYVKLNNQSSSQNATCVSYKIVDDKDTTVKNSTVSNLVVNSGSNNSFYTTLNLQLGDLNYSGGLTSDDANILLSIVTEIIEPSHLQTVLGDMNQDGDIDIMDVIALNKLLLNSKAISAEEINAMFAQYEEYFRANGIETASEFYESCSIDVTVQ